NLSIKELGAFITDLGESKFRIKQVSEWLWKKGVHEFSEMRNLPKSLIKKLEERSFIDKAIVTEELISKDGSRKYAFTSMDGKLVEGVLIPSRKRVTACISVQAGCNVKCKFCATGQLGLQRNLSKGEIFDQIYQLNQKSQDIFGSKLSNIVVMGMGEPFLNYSNVINALDMVSCDEGLGFSPQRITISTVGIIEGIDLLANHPRKYNLAISLHTAVESIRKQLIPIAVKNDLADLRKSLENYHEKTGSRITLEYILFDKLNDDEKHMKALAQFCKAFPSKINLIEYNSVPELPFVASSEDDTSKFQKFLEDKNMLVYLRKSKGSDIFAACGQLANKKM
ncbi:MAG: 23S rRNA (adenine(2503)-C(2))-methyltransferase RlmN, partial [Marinilabiliales bacterium]